MKKIFAGLILAKKNSKRLPGKNMKDFCGKPMFLINTKKCLKVFDLVYVSSDDQEILNIAKKIGAVPIFRPSNLVGDVPNIPVYKHALKNMSKVDGIVAVQSCSPTIDIKLIKTARNLMGSGCQELMTCHPVERNSDYHQQNFKIYGSIWALSKNRLNNYGSPYKPNPEILLVDDSVDINYPKDYKKALKQCL